MDSQRLKAMLESGVTALNRGDLPSAEKIFTDILSMVPQEANSLHFMGVICRKKGHFADSEAYFKRSLAVNSKQPAVLNALGNLFAATGRQEEALTSYQQATAMQPSFADAWFNQGLVLQALGNHEEALPAFEKAVQLSGGRASHYSAQGISLQKLGRYEAAIERFRKALESDPSNVNALHNLGSVYKEMYRVDDARACLEEAIARAPRLAEPRYVLGNIYYEAGDVDRADTEYRTAIAIKPDFRDAHRSLNKLYWEHGRKELFAKSYAVGHQAAPDNADLCADHLEALENAGRVGEALSLAENYQSKFPGHTGLQKRMGRLSEAVGDLEKAVSFYRASLAGEDGDVSTSIDLARVEIKREKYETSLQALEPYAAVRPFDQELWALRGTCWHLLGDDRDAWLHRYDQFVQPMMLGTPEGYSCLEDFLDDLQTALMRLHTAEGQPIDQTLRGGSQTHGTLLDRPEPVFRAFRGALSDCVQTYIDQLPDDPDHPLLCRKSDGFDFSASWSVRLRKDGFHVNHVHALGWISSAFYVDVPENSPKEDAAHEGWIKFGESGLGLGERDTIQRCIKPQRGMLALFPSYMWHGTVPFTQDRDRMTAPFDVVPL
ncbi:tetratricopeptide repeat protein [Kordiimonas sediminis]|uniref:tetratricopeptide repeat protein n=1 Tax=Kordiimonas sediminis TaxID=1735581 RepID=UPI0017489288|nr:tetratricopeptide repeat protein [Kordiimonas sediminis]